MYLRIPGGGGVQCDVECVGSQVQCWISLMGISGGGGEAWDLHINKIFGGRALDLT